MRRTVGTFLIVVLSLSAALHMTSAASLAEQSKLKVARSVQDNLARIEEIFRALASKVEKLEENRCKSNLVELLGLTKMMLEHENTNCGTKFAWSVGRINGDMLNEKLEVYENEAFDCLTRAFANTRNYFDMLKRQIEVCAEWGKVWIKSCVKWIECRKIENLIVSSKKKLKIFKIINFIQIFSTSQNATLAAISCARINAASLTRSAAMALINVATTLTSQISAKPSGKIASSIAAGTRTRQTTIFRKSIDSLI